MERESRLANQCVSIVIGLGEVGRPLLDVLARVHPMQGVDLDPVEAPQSVDMLHVCYPMEIPNFVSVTAEYARRYRPAVVVIHSTVSVGTTSTVQAILDIPVVHSPVRGKHARLGQELLHYVKFIGVRDAHVAERVQRHFEAAGMRTKWLSSPEATELAKLTETTYLGLLVAFAQDVDRMARRSGVSYDDVAAFYEEIGYLPRVPFFPGVIGGHCVMPNITLLKRSLGSQLLDAIEWSNEQRKAETL